jgi:hypothetical protein
VAEWPRHFSTILTSSLCRPRSGTRARTATRYFRITVASLNRLDGQYLRYNLSYLARGAALAGYVEEARQALLPAGDAPQFPLFYADWQIAEAALMAAERDFEAATERALRAARHAASLGQRATMAIDDPAALTSVSARFEELGTVLYAAEAAYATARGSSEGDGGGEARNVLDIRLRALQLGREMIT